MSAGEAGVAILWKPLLWVLGGTLALLKALLAYIWFSESRKNKKTSDELAGFKEHVRENYYDKESIHLLHKPMQDTLSRFVDVTEELKNEVTKIQVQNARNGNERRD